MSKKTGNLYLDIHVLQTVPPSCVNRDDVGSPKTAVYGGTTRARVSSQCWKRATRMYFQEHMNAENLGIRTKQVVALVRDGILAEAPEVTENQAEAVVWKVLNAAHICDQDTKNKEKSKTLVFLGSGDLDAIKAACLDELKPKDDAEAAEPEAAEEQKPKNGKKDKEKCSKAVTALVKRMQDARQPLDIALFGRMVAGTKTLSVDAAAQVAHALSTHAVTTEFDFFTAVDDFTTDETGSAYMDTLEFDSSTLYRYASVNIAELAETYGEDAAAGAVEFLKAFALSMPTGRVNSYANHTFPGLVYATLRTDQPVSLCGAFEDPVKPGRDGGYMQTSAARLSEYAKSAYENIVGAPERAYCASVDMTIPGSEALPLPDMAARLQADITEYMEGR